MECVPHVYANALLAHCRHFWCELDAKVRVFFFFIIIFISDPKLHSSTFVSLVFFYSVLPGVKPGGLL